MILSELKHYLSERPSASLADIALHLDVEPDVARAMIDLWIAKGRVERLGGQGACGGCDRCTPGSLELYRWRDGQAVSCPSAEQTG
jgi:putative ferrous iron transport protein C